MGLLVPAPRDPLAVLERNFDVAECKTPVWSHRTESLTWPGSRVACRHIGKMLQVALVTRTPVVVVSASPEEVKGCNETLHIRGGPALSFFVDYGSQTCR